MAKAKVKVALAPNPGKVTDKQLASFLHAFQGNEAAIDAVSHCCYDSISAFPNQVGLQRCTPYQNRGLVELTLAVLQAMRIEADSNFHEVSAAHKVQSTLPAQTPPFPLTHTVIDVLTPSAVSPMILRRFY